MDYIKAKDIDISKKTKKNWQEIVDIIAELTDVTASLIMKVEPPYMKVFRSSKSKNNPYNVGDKKNFQAFIVKK
jgi:hypothetical protein